MCNEIFEVVVDYNLTLDQMVEEGKYDWKTPSLHEETFTNCNGDGQVNVELQLVHMNKPVQLKEVMAHLNELNLRPATLPELLAMGAQYPEVQRKFTVAALGSVWDMMNIERVAHMFEDEGRRIITLRWNGFEWLEHYRFLAVRK